MKIKLILSIVILIGAGNLFAQTLNDALRMSDLNIGSTARSAGVAGSMTAIGGDYSVISMNPAGLATYRKGQVMLTPGYFTSNSESRLLTTNNGLIKDNINKLTINNVGIIWSKKPAVYEDEDGEYYSVSNWKTSNFTIGLNRIADLNANITTNGETLGALADQFLYTADDGNGAADQFGDALALDINYIDFFDIPGTNESELGHDAENQILYKEQTIERRGSINEVVLGWGGNYAEKLLVGANIGIPIVNYSEEKIYSEIDRNDEIPVFNNARYDENLDISGAGFNIKVGAIYMPTRKLRVGLAIQTPTFYQLDDTYTTSLTYDGDIPDVRNGPATAESPIGETQYRILTPWRASTGLGYIFGRNGFLSADIEYVNYAGTSYDLDIDFDDPDNDLFEQELNDEIDDFATSAINIRFGGEVAFKGVRLRAGYAILGQQLDIDVSSKKLMSFGLGYTFGSFFVDAAIQRLSKDLQYSPYSNPFTGQDVDIALTQNRALLTFGVRL